MLRLLTGVSVRSRGGLDINRPIKNIGRSKMWTGDQARLFALYTRLRRRRLMLGIPARSIAILFQNEPFRWKAGFETAAFTRFAFDFQPGLMAGEHMLDNGKSQACSPGFARTPAIHSVK